MESKIVAEAAREKGSGSEVSPQNIYTKQHSMSSF
jgi:hypothetical protein